MGVLVDFRLTLGHLGASLIDLVQRGALGAEATDGPDGPDWILTDRRGPGTPKPAYQYESQLLDSLFAGPSPLRLSELTADTVRGLGKVESLLLEDMRQWHWVSSVGHDAPDITGHGREVRQHVYAFRRELTSQFWAGRDVSALAAYVTAFKLASEPDPMTAAWLAACDHFRDPEFSSPTRPLADEPVRVFYLNWVAPPGFRRESPFRQHDDTGLADWAAGVEEHQPDEPSRLVRWLRAVRLATRRD
jgi:hypothetical protein